MGFGALVLLGCGMGLGEGRAAIGRTEASFGVSPTGAATYTIPVPATSGVQAVGGFLQYAGDSMTAKDNVLAGGASALTGGAMHGIGGGFLQNGTNYRARAHNASMQLRMAFAGVGVDLAGSALQGLAPRQANCE